MTDVMTRLDPQRFDTVFEAARGGVVVVLGDVMLDRYLWGEVSRISPEAPVPVVEVDEETTRLGGGANVAQNVSSLRARPVLVSVIGRDDTADLLRRRLDESGIPDTGLVVDGTRRTTIKTRVVARGQHVVRADQEDLEEIAEPVVERVLERTLDVLGDARALIISDYGKGVVTRSLLERLLPEARARKIPVCVDPKDAHFFAYTGVAVITPNQYEAAEVLGYKLRTEESVGRAGTELLERLGSDAVLITRGARGMSLFEPGGRRTDFPVLPRQVYDVTGAGDTVVGTYAVAVSGGATAREASLMATHAAGLVVSEVGTAVPDFEEFRRTFLPEES